MNKIVIILLMIMSVSCNKKDKIKSFFITNKNEYWECLNYCYNSGSTYFQFKENGSYDVFLRSYVGFDLFNDDGDLISGSRPWSIKNDSTFVWDKWNYKIEKMSKNEILLSYYHYEIKNKKCYVRLSKWVNTPQGPKLLDQPDNIKK